MRLTVDVAERFAENLLRLRQGRKLSQGQKSPRTWFARCPPRRQDPSANEYRAQSDKDDESSGDQNRARNMRLYALKSV